MLYDATACYFVLTAYGMKILFDRLPRFLDYIVGILCLTLLGHALVVDLPYRVKTEYFNYNGFQLDAYQEIEKYGIRNAIIFFNTEQVYSKYMAFNSITFDGDLIYALSQGSEKDAELVSKFPEKSVFYFDTNSPERKLKESPNFYRTDLKLLEQYIYSLRSSVPNANIYAVTPWEPYSSIKLSKIQNLAVLDPINIYNLFVLRTSGPSDYIFLFDRATGLENILTHFYELETLSGPPFESKHRLFRIIKPVSFPAKEIPGVLFRCYRGVKLEESKVFLQTVIPYFDISPCISEHTSMSWAAQFRLKNSLIFKMDLRSDNGAAVYIDDEMVLNNGFFEKEGVRRTAKTIQLSPGTHSISVKYFNGPGPYKLELLINGLDITNHVFLLEETSELGFYVSMDELQVQNALHR